MIPEEKITPRFNINDLASITKFGTAIEMRVGGRKKNSIDDTFEELIPPAIRIPTKKMFHVLKAPFKCRYPPGRAFYISTLMIKENPPEFYRHESQNGSP